MLKLLFGGAMALLLAFQAEAESAPDARGPVVRVGVLAYAPPWTEGAFIAESVEYLGWKLPGIDFVLEHYDERGLLEAVHRGDVDLVAASNTFVRMNADMGLEILAALASNASASPDRASAGTVVVRRDNAGIRTMDDLAGKQVAVAGDRATPGRFEVEALLAADGLTPSGLFSGMIEHGPLRMRKVLEDVLSGRADAGIVRACFIEDLKTTSGADLFQDLRVIDERSGDGLACRHSTDVHGGWVIGTVSTATGELATQLTAALLAKPSNAWGKRWLVATDLRATDRMLERLQLGPYAYSAREAASSIWREYQGVIWTALVLMIGLFFHALRLRRVVAQRTKELELTHSREQEALRSAQKASDHLDQLQRAGVVGQMSSIIAHEMKQPLAVIQNVCRGLERSMENEDPPEPEDVVRAVRTIEQEAARAATIVDRVRALAKSPSGRREHIEVEPALRHAIEQFESSRRSKAQIILHAEGSGRIRMNAVDFELIIFNILSNASDAAAHSAHPSVDVFLAREADSVVISIRDNGPRISDEELAAMAQRPLSSTKANGMGLGLMIVKSLIESAVGRLEFEHALPHGLITRVVLPCAGGDEMMAARAEHQG